MKPAAAAALFLALAGLCLSEDEIEPAGYLNPWATRSVGDYVRLEAKSRSPMGDTVKIWTVTLLKKSAKSLTVRLDEEKNGKPVSSESELPLGAFDATSACWEETGKEALELDGKQWECRVLRRTDFAEGRERRSWRAKIEGKEQEVKGVEIDTTGKGGKTTRTRKILKFAEVVEIGNEKVACRVVETVYESGSEDGLFRSTETRWETDRIALGFAKFETKLFDGKIENVETTTVKGFGAAKSD